MNRSLPIIVAHPNQDFRFLLRDMLIKNGFYHVLEAPTMDECLSVMNEERDNFFTLIDGGFLSAEIGEQLKREKKFLILASDKTTPSKIAALGVNHFITFPFSSIRLIERMSVLS